MEAKKVHFEFTFVKWLDEILSTFKHKIRKVLLRKNGWNVDVPITSHYRQGPKRGPKKYSTPEVLKNGE